jgi:MFS superfamily sulfate permease-like transporter
MVISDSTSEWKDPLHVPDRIFFALAMLSFLLSTLFVIWVWPQLPARIPQHIDITGAVDAYAEKNFFSVFGVTIVNLLIGGAIWFAYRHPEYTNLPTTIPWTKLPAPLRTQLTAGVRHLLAMTITWSTLLLSCVHLDLTTRALGVGDSRATVMLWVLVGLMLTSVGGYTILLTRWIQHHRP